MHSQLMDVLARFQEKGAVQESMHNFNTQLNESINNRISKYAPKNKHFGATKSLDTRIASVIAVSNMGYGAFYNALVDQYFTINNVSMDSLKHNICKIDSNKNNDKKRKSTVDFKRQRKFGKEAKAQKEIYEERVDRDNNYGTYQSSIAVNDSTNTEKEPNASKTKFCKWCDKMTNHKTWQSKHCVSHHAYLENKAVKQNTNNMTTITEAHHGKNKTTNEAEEGGVRTDGVVKGKMLVTVARGGCCFGWWCCVGLW